MGIVICNFENCKHKRESKTPTRSLLQEFNGAPSWFDPWIITVAHPAKGILNLPLVMKRVKNGHWGMFLQYLAVEEGFTGHHLVD